MTINISALMTSSILWGTMTNLVLAQGSFQNLDFESPLAPLVPVNGLLPTSSAIPGWVGWLGDSPHAVALYNNLTIGTAAIALEGPGFPDWGIVEGNYTVLLASGRNPAGQDHVNAAISQTGLVPFGTRSVLFKVGTGGAYDRVGLSLDGADIPVLVLAATARYTLYGADAASFAGRFAELKFTSYWTTPKGLNAIFLDSIVFSDQALNVPEPSNVCLLGAGIWLLVQRFRDKHE